MLGFADGLLDGRVVGFPVDTTAGLTVGREVTQGLSCTEKVPCEL